MKHCSNCGERITQGQQFCRSCGAELVTEGSRRGISPRTLMMIGMLSILVSCVVVLLGNFLDSKTIAFFGAVAAVISFGVMVTGAFLGQSSRRRRTKEARPTAVANQRPELEKADTTNRLQPPPADEYFPASITEHTTTKLHQK